MPIDDQTADQVRRRLAREIATTRWTHFGGPTEPGQDEWELAEALVPVVEAIADELESEDPGALPQ